MIVVDASATAEALVFRTQIALRCRRRIWSAPELHVPGILKVEVTAALRGLLLGRKISGETAGVARRDLSWLEVTMHPFEPYADRVWELRNNATVYDAWYLAVAERMDMPLVTTDARLESVPGIRCEVEVIAV